MQIVLVTHEASGSPPPARRPAASWYRSLIEGAGRQRLMRWGGRLAGQTERRTRQAGRERDCSRGKGQEGKNLAVDALGIQPVQD